jgi:glycosyltransferase involved in cell wall biosynthesis
LGGFVGEDRGDFDKAVAAAGLSNRFEVVPWLPFGEAYDKMRHCDIGMVLFQPGRLNHVHALPHKLFDYMLAELPVIVPDFATEVSRIVGEAGCGLMVNTGEPRQIADALRTLARDPGRRNSMGALGRAAVLERYNWEVEAGTLIKCYQELMAQP